MTQATSSSRASKKIYGGYTRPGSREVQKGGGLHKFEPVLAERKSSSKYEPSAFLLADQVAELAASSGIEARNDYIKIEQMHNHMTSTARYQTVNRMDSGVSTEQLRRSVEHLHNPITSVVISPGDVFSPPIDKEYMDLMTDKNFDDQQTIKTNKVDVKALAMDVAHNKTGRIAIISNPRQTYAPREKFDDLLLGKKQHRHQPKVNNDALSMGLGGNPHSHMSVYASLNSTLQNIGEKQMINDGYQMLNTHYKQQPQSQLSQQRNLPSRKERYGNGNNAGQMSQTPVENQNHSSALDLLVTGTRPAETKIPMMSQTAACRFYDVAQQQMNLQDKKLPETSTMIQRATSVQSKFRSQTQPPQGQYQQMLQTKTYSIGKDLKHLIRKSDDYMDYLTKEPPINSKLRENKLVKAQSKQDTGTEMGNSPEACTKNSQLLDEQSSNRKSRVYSNLAKDHSTIDQDNSSTQKKAETPACSTYKALRQDSLKEGSQLEEDAEHDYIVKQLLANKGETPIGTAKSVLNPQHQERRRRSFIDGQDQYSNLPGRLSMQRGGSKGQKTIMLNNPIYKQSTRMKVQIKGVGNELMPMTDGTYVSNASDFARTVTNGDVPINDSMDSCNLSKMQRNSEADEYKPRGRRFQALKLVSNPASQPLNPNTDSSKVKQPEEVSSRKQSNDSSNEKY